MRIKDWLMSMETLAEEAKDLNLEEPEAIEYMLTNLHVQGLPASRRRAGGRRSLSSPSCGDQVCG